MTKNQHQPTRHRIPATETPKKGTLLRSRLGTLRHHFFFRVSVPRLCSQSNPIRGLIPFSIPKGLAPSASTFLHSRGFGESTGTVPSLPPPPFTLRAFEKRVGADGGGGARASPPSKDNNVKPGTNLRLKRRLHGQRLLLGDEGHRRRVHAVPLPRRLRSVVKN